MARKPIAISVASETRDFSKGVRDGVVEPLEDAEKALKEVERAGDRAGDELEDSMRDAQRETEELKDEYKRLEQVMKDGAAPRKFKQNTADATSSAKRDLQELGDESRQNASEMFSSFDGSIESLADGIQGTLGGIVGSIGPIGAAAGAAGAAGVGLLMTKFEEAKEREEALRQKTAELASEFIDAGNDGERSFAGMGDELRDLAEQADEAEASLRDVRDIARLNGLEYRTLADAYAGNSDALSEMIGKLEQQRDLNKDAIDAQVAGAESLNLADAERFASTQRGIEQLKEQRDAIDAAAEAEKLWRDAGGPEIEAKAGHIASLNDAYDDAAGAVDDFLDEESGVFDVQKYIDAMAARTQALQDYQDNLATAGLSTEAQAFLNEQGAETAALMVQGYLDASPEQQKKLEEIWTEAGKTDSASYIAEVQKVFSNPLDAPTVNPLQIDTTQAETTLSTFINRQRTVRVDVEAFTPDGRAII